MYCDIGPPWIESSTGTRPVRAGRTIQASTSPSPAGDGTVNGSGTSPDTRSWNAADSAVRRRSVPSGSRTNSSGRPVGVLATNATVPATASNALTTRLPPSSRSGVAVPSAGTRYTCTSPRSSTGNSRSSPSHTGARGTGRTAGPAPR